MAEIVLTQTESGRTVEVRSGDIVTVRLTENPTTGYRWEVVSGPPPSSDNFTAATGAPGAGGQRVLRYTIAEPGAVRIGTELRRQWETGSAPQERFEVTILAQ